MGQIEILKKLDRELQKDIHEECQVVYILSRIRKYLEIKNQKGQYKYLNFYCNWALHAKIDRTEPVVDVLHEFIEGHDDGKFLHFHPLFDDLRNFLKDNNLSEKLFEEENLWRFANLLVDIYSDTPIEVKKRVITIQKPKTPLTGKAFFISYTIK
ncbi:MAG: hypothetical protein PHE49_08285 [bacterium]|nr:hypothetical protein [bacterium]